MTSPASVLRRYTFKLYPNRAQEAALHGQREMCCDLWNAFLQMREEHWRREQRKPKEARKGLTAFDQAKEVTKLRAACPEWKEMNSASQALVAKMLDEAFKAFFRRAKAGKGAASGYPIYKSRRRWETIPFREMGCGWKLTNGRCAAGAQAQSHIHSKGQHEIPSGDPVNGGGAQVLDAQYPFGPSSGAPVNGGGAQEFVKTAGHLGASGTPENGGGVGGAWRLYVKGVPGLIRARGRLPGNPLSWRNANILWRDDAWWLSVCVEMAPARRPGSDTIKIRLDLIDTFARVERAEGAMSAPRESANPTGAPEVTAASGAPTGETGSDDRNGKALRVRGDGGAPTDGPRSDDRRGPRADDAHGGAPTGEIGTLAASLQHAAALTRAADAVKADRDIRLRKRSWRWRRETRRAARLTGKAARVRREALHLWTTRTIAAAATLDVAAPKVRAVTASARGTPENPGGAVETVAALNRNTLNQAPASAVQMLRYKAEEAGIPFTLIEDEAPPTSIGQDLSATTRLARKARRAIKKEQAA